MPRDFEQLEWNEAVAEDARQLIRLAIREDLDRAHDWTTVALVHADRRGEAALVARQPGVLSGLPIAEMVLTEAGADLALRHVAEDGDPLGPGDELAVLSGSVRALLTLERTILNFMGRLSGIATKTRHYVDEVVGTQARIYDTRKTTPGWRRLEKYAVRCGGGHNHRLGLYDHLLIKDNHLAFLAEQIEAEGGDPSRAVEQAIERARAFLAGQGSEGSAAMIEIEVDTLDQLRAALPLVPEIVLLDNMSPTMLREAVLLRDELSPETELEASGGITTDRLREVAETGIDRISAGALTHSAISLDIGLDWRDG